MKKISKVLFMAFAFLFAIGFSVHADAATETPGIWEGEYYYIKNVSSGLYLEVNPDTENVRINSFTGAKNQKWKFRQKSNGTYVLIPQYDTEQRLDVYPANNKQDGNVDIFGSTNDTDQEWKVKRNKDYSTYTLTSGCSDFTKYLSAVGTTAKANVVQSTQYGTNQRSWTLEKASRDWASHFPAKLTDDIDTTGVNSAFTKYVEKMGYTSCIKTNSTAAYAYDNMFEDIWIYNGHGYKSEVCFFTSSMNTNGNICAHSSQKSSSKDRFVYSHDANFLSGNRVTLLMACQSGKSVGSYNLVDAIYERGSQFVLGPTVNRYVGYDNMWIEAFLKACSEKKTVAQALVIADTASPKSSNYYCRGNTYQKLFP